ncbi:hypothetical protein WA158_001183 [Blastocystis sp. Blastoise]
MANFALFALVFIQVALSSTCGTFKDSCRGYHDHPYHHTLIDYVVTNNADSAVTGFSYSTVDYDHELCLDEYRVLSYKVSYDVKNSTLLSTGYVNYQVDNCRVSMRMKSKEPSSLSLINFPYTCNVTVNTWYDINDVLCTSNGQPLDLHKYFCIYENSGASFLTSTSHFYIINSNGYAIADYSTSEGCNDKQSGVVLLIAVVVCIIFVILLFVCFGYWRQHATHPRPVINADGFRKFSI